MEEEAMRASKPISLRTMHGFLAKRRPQLRDLSKANEADIGDWFAESVIIIGSMADTPERVNDAGRLLSACFARTMREINAASQIRIGSAISPRPFTEFGSLSLAKRPHDAVSPTSLTRLQVYFSHFPASRTHTAFSEGVNRRLDAWQLLGRCLTHIEILPTLA